MRSNFDFILFSGVVFCCGESGGGAESVYRLFRGRKSGQRLIKILKKIEKMKNFKFLFFSSKFDEFRTKNDSFQIHVD